MSIFSSPFAMGGFSFLGNLIESLINRPIVEGANERNLARADEAIGFIREAAGNVPNIPSGSGLQGIQQNFDFGSFLPQGPSGASVLGDFQPGATPRVGQDRYAYDPAYLRNAAQEITRGLGANRLQAGSLMGQVNLPDFEGGARLSERLESSAEGFNRAGSLAGQQAVASGLGMGQDLQQISGDQLARIGLETDYARGRAGQQIASDIEGQEQAYNLQRGGIQAGLASTEAQINSALAQAAENINAQLQGQGESLLAGDLGQRLGGSIAQAGLDENALSRALQLAMGQAGMAESGLNRQFNATTQGFNAQMGLANAIANAMQGEHGLRMGGASNMASILSGVSEMLPLWNLGINESLGLAMQAQALRDAQNAANQTHGGVSVLGSGFNW